MSTTMIGGWELGLLLVLLPLVLPAFVFQLRMLVNCRRSPRLWDVEKLTWVIVIVFTHFVDALIYLIFGRSSRA
jgi:hypothetical protein